MKIVVTCAQCKKSLDWSLQVGRVNLVMRGDKIKFYKSLNTRHSCGSNILRVSIDNVFILLSNQCR